MMVDKFWKRSAMKAEMSSAMLGSVTLPGAGMAGGVSKVSWDFQ